MNRRRERIHIEGIDWLTVLIYLALVGIGWITLYAIHHDDLVGQTVFSLDYPVGKQTMWMGISFLALTATLIIDPNFWRTFAFPIYGIGILLLVSVLIFGTEIKGARSWLTIGSAVSFQPAEFAKFATALATASYLSSFSSDLRDSNTRLISFGLITLPALLILLQSDAGSAFVFSAFLIMFYRAGLSPNLYIILFLAVIVFIAGLLYPIKIIAVVLLLASTIVIIQSLEKSRLVNILMVLAGGFTVYGLWAGLDTILLYVNSGLLFFGIVLNISLKNFRQVALTSSLFGAALLLSFASNYVFNNVLEKHQQDRVNVWLQPEKSDPRGSLYNIMQSKMAIGSGGPTGKGFLKGTMTKFDYVPEQSTDFVFCTIGEEYGFIGSLVVILLFVALLNRMIVIAERQRGPFVRYYGYAVASLVLIHFFINIGMTLGLVPVIGIPLPFISYGGSSLMMFSIMLGVLLKLDTNRYHQ